VGSTPCGVPERASRGTLTRTSRRGFPLGLGGVGETPPPLPRDAGPEVGDMWGKPPVRGDTAPGMSQGRVVTTHVTPP